MRRIADSSILRLYQSKLEKMQQSSALSAYVAKADEWRERLWAERRELMEGFVEALKVNTAGGVKKKVALPAVNLFHNSV